MHLTRRILPFLAALIVCSSFAATPSSSPALPVFFDNSAEAIPSDPAWASALNEKLTAFKNTQGITFIVRLQTKSPSAEEDKVPGAYMRSLAAKLGTAQSGIVAVYFADEDDWRLWVGDELTAKFSDKTGTPKELTKSGAIHDAKEALFATAAAKRDTAFAALQKSATADEQPSPAKRIQLHTEAVVDEVIKKFAQK